MLSAERSEASGRPRSVGGQPARGRTLRQAGRRNVARLLDAVVVEMRELAGELPEIEPGTAGRDALRGWRDTLADISYPGLFLQRGEDLVITDDERSDS